MKRPARVLIIDDDRDVAESLADVVESRGHAVGLAFSGEEGLAKFRAQDFDVVFVDVKMPGMNGVETYLKVRKLRPGTNVVMMTGFSVEQVLREASQRGALRVVDKASPEAEIVPIVKGFGAQRVLLGASKSDFAVNVVAALKAEGLDVGVVETGQDTLDRTIDGEVDCLIVDQQMPVLSGFDIYLSLSWIGRAVPTIIATHRAREHIEAMDLLQPMADAILSKPFDPVTVLDEIDRLREATA
jgi:two-component system response regulator HydG